MHTRQLHLPPLLVEEVLAEQGAGEFLEFIPNSLLDSGDGGAAAWLP